MTKYDDIRSFLIMLFDLGIYLSEKYTIIYLTWYLPELRSCFHCILCWHWQYTVIEAVEITADGTIIVFPLLHSRRLRPYTTCINSAYTTKYDCNSETMCTIVYDTVLHVPNVYTSHRNSQKTRSRISISHDYYSLIVFPRWSKFDYQTDSLEKHKFESMRGQFVDTPVIEATLWWT